MFIIAPLEGLDIGLESLVNIGCLSGCNTKGCSCPGPSI